MKKCLCIHILLLLFLPQIRAQWQIVNDLKDTCTYRDICFADSLVGYAVAGDFGFHSSWGQVNRTTDGGKNWEVVLDLEPGGICPYECALSGKGTVYIGGDPFSNRFADFFYQSSDSGRSWDGLDVWVRKLLFLNADQGLAVGDLPNIGIGLLRTLNGGTDWEAHSSPYHIELWNTLSMSFLNLNRGWMLVYVFDENGLNEFEDVTHLYYYEDGFWEPVYSGISTLQKVIFTDESCGYIAGSFATEMDYYPFLLKSKNGGKYWSEVPMPYVVNDMYFFDRNIGWVACVTDDGKGCLLETTDGGDSWTGIDDLYAEPLVALDFRDGVGWALGEDGLILKNANSGYIPTGFEHERDGLDQVDLSVHPNPFSSETIIEYTLPNEGRVEISIYDLSGRKLAILTDEIQPPGMHEKVWNTSGYKPGIYFCILETNRYRQVRKLILPE